MSKHHKSSRDMLQLIAELNVRRMPMVFDSWHRKLMGVRMTGRGQQNIKVLLDRMTTEQQVGYRAVRTLHWRYDEGKFYHQDKELRQALSFCRFLLRLYSEIKHQEPKAFDIDEQKMSTQADLPPDSYDVAKSLTGTM